VWSFARCWTTDLRHRRIRVNVISPGHLETAIFTKAGLMREQSDEFRGSLVAAVPMGRMGTPDEVALDWRKILLVETVRREPLGRCARRSPRLRAQDEVASALRTATPKYVFERVGG
jgi:Enoyl-(Acyl carrier protein) reductase